MHLQTMNYFEFINRIRAASKGVATEELDTFAEMMGYTAPENRDTAFWLGKGSVPGLTELCTEHFPENNEVFDIFQDAKKAYSASKRVSER